MIVDAPGYAACLVGWETPERDGDRIFEAVWTMDAPVVRRAAQVGAALAARTRAGMVRAPARACSRTARSRSRRRRPV